MNRKKTLIMITIFLMGCMTLSGCGKKDGAATDKVQESMSEQSREESSDNEQKSDEEKPEKKQKKSGKLPKIILHRNSVFEHNKNGQRVIDHKYSFLSLEEDRTDSYGRLVDNLKAARDEIEADEKKKRDKEIESLKENELFSYEESWYTYVRRADSDILSFITEYVATGQYDGEFYSEYTAHNYYTDSGDEIKFSDIVVDEEAFFDLLAGKLKEYYEYAKKNIYYIDADTDKEQIKEDVKDYMKAGSCTWTIDPQGVSVFLNSYTGLPSAVSATVLFSEDENGKIFSEEFQEKAMDEWIMQIPEHVESYCDINDNGKTECVHVYPITEMKEYEGSEEYFISGLQMMCDGQDKKVTTVMPGGTDFYDVFLMHKDKKTVLFENHYEYDTAFIDTYSFGADAVTEADAIRAQLELAKDDDIDSEGWAPYYIPTDMSKIRVLVEEDNEARDQTADVLSVDPDGKIKLKYGENEHFVRSDDDGSTTVNVGEKIDPFFGLWLQAFKDKSEAEALVNKLKDKGLEAYYVYTQEWENLSKEPYYCVTLGESGSEPEAQAYLKDAADAGYKDAYVKYTGERLTHRIYYYVYNENSIEISPDEVIINNVQIEELSGGAVSEAALIVDKDTKFDMTCDMQFFPYYEKGSSPLDWFNHIESIKGTDEYKAQGGALMGVFEVSITGNHIDSFFGSYWWD